jgi:hypothetical protein
MAIFNLLLLIYFTHLFLTFSQECVLMCFFLPALRKESLHLCQNNYIYIYIYEFGTKEQET